MSEASTSVVDSTADSAAGPTAVTIAEPPLNCASTVLPSIAASTGLPSVAVTT